MCYVLCAFAMVVPVKALVVGGSRCGGSHYRDDTEQHVNGDVGSIRDQLQSDTITI